MLFVAGIIFFCFFYVSIIFNPNEAADNMRKYGGFIPGIRPGRNTADYMNNILTKITVVGGIYLSILCLIPDIMISGIQLQHLPLIGNWSRHMLTNSHMRFLLEGLNVQFLFRRHFAADRGGRGDGYHQPDRSPAHHAPLRRVSLRGRGRIRGRRSVSRFVLRLSGLVTTICEGDCPVRLAWVRQRAPRREC